MAKGSTIGKNPSVEWFFNDWHGGTMTMSRHQKGCYIDLLTAQFNNGHLSLDEVRNVLGNDFAAWQGVLQKKFAQDPEGKFYNVRLEIQILKKGAYNKSRIDNLSSGGEPPHMGNGNGNGLGNELEQRKQKFFEEALEYVDQFDEQMINKFCRYWTETARNGKKMKFEKQETFEVKARLETWRDNAKNWNNGNNQGSNGKVPDRYNAGKQDYTRTKF